jgi:hypothetical protein
MPLIETRGSGSVLGYGRGSGGLLLKQAFSHTSSAQYFTIPNGTSRITAKLWGGSGGEYNASVNLNNGGGTGGYTETTFNIIPGETILTVIVGGGSNYGTSGYGGGGAGPNGGSHGGGCSAIFSGSISNPFTNTVVGGGSTASVPSSTVTSLSGATQVIAVAGGGGGAGWYNFNNMYGGGGGGLIGANSLNGYATAFGGTQTGSTNGSQSTGAGKFSGGSWTANQSGGGSGGGGGGWFGGGLNQGSSSNNTSGGGGSGFIGYANNSTSTVLTPNQANNRDYIDNTTRVNGSRLYTNSSTLSKDAGVFVPHGNTDIDYVSGIAVPTYYPGNDGTSILSGHGRVVLYAYSG